MSFDVASREALERRVIAFAGSEASTHRVDTCTVVCSCGCGCLSTTPQFYGFLEAHLWPDQIRFTIRMPFTGMVGLIARLLERLFLFYAKVKGFKSHLVMIRFMDGTFVQCEPIALRIGRRDFCTERGCKWILLGTANVDAEFDESTPEAK